MGVPEHPEEGGVGFFEVAVEVGNGDARDPRLEKSPKTELSIPESCVLRDEAFGDQHAGFERGDPERRRIQIRGARVEDGRKLVLACRDDENDDVGPFWTCPRLAAKLLRAHVGERILDDDERGRFVAQGDERSTAVVGRESLVPARREYLGDDRQRRGRDSYQQRLHSRPRGKH